MTRYRDRETGEVVQFGGATMHGVLIFRRNSFPQIYTKQEFDARFEPVEDATAQPGVK